MESFSPAYLRKRFLENEDFIAIVLICKQLDSSLFMQSASLMEFVRSLGISNPSAGDIGVLYEFIQTTLLRELDKEQRTHLEQNLIELSNKLHLSYKIDIPDVFLQQTQQNPPTQAPLAESLQSLKAQIMDLIEELSDLCKTREDKLRGIATNLTDEHFSIGVTGVLSAGKSTFLNALLGEEILGTSSIPETANLTILRYGEIPSVEVRFWNTKEWEELERQSGQDNALRRFIDESKEIFGARLQEYILPDARREKIESTDLRAYTSANHPQKLCNLVSEVTFLTPLKFLENNVSIVDTPGLDDPITQREEITKDHLKNCDLLIHLMNASCAATQTDIDFLLETLLEHNISRLALVLTRADLISQDELRQSMEYTKHTLENQIRKLSLRVDVQEIISRITFFPLCGYQALLCKQNKKSPLPLEKTGIVEIERYLEYMLLGEESLKHQDILYLAINALQTLMQETKADLKIQESLFSANKEELNKKLQDIENQTQLLNKSAQTIKDTIHIELSEIEQTKSMLEEMLFLNLKNARDSLCDRVSANIIYNRDNNHSFVSQDLEDSLCIALKDIFASLAREYKFRLNNKIAQSIQRLKNEKIQIADFPSFNFVLRDHQVEHFARDLTLKIVNIAKDRNLRAKMEPEFAEIFLEFEILVREKSQEIQNAALTFFNNLTNLVQADYDNKIAHIKQLAQSTLELIQNGDNQAAKATISQNLQKLEGFLAQATVLQGKLLAFKGME